MLRRLGLDPAIVSGPFITTIVDGTGLIIYFAIARYVLNLWDLLVHGWERERRLLWFGTGQ